MADYNSQLPVRTENAGDVIAKIADATVPSQQLKVESDGSINVNAAFAPNTEVKITDGTDDLAINADGSINAVVSATNLDIRDLVFATDKVDASGSTVELGATSLAALENINAVVSATDLDIRNLVFATDKVDISGSTVELGSTSLAALESITVQNGAGASAVNIQDGGNSITVDAADLDIRDLNSATDSVTVVATNLDVRDLTHASDSVKVGDGTDFLVVNSDGSINVKLVDYAPDTAVVDYNTASAVAANASSTHTYTSTGNFYLEQVEASGSGKVKIEIQVNGATKAVLFNSTANPNMSLFLKQPILATTGQTVTVIRTNKDNQAQDLYSTIIGYTA